MVTAAIRNEVAYAYLYGPEQAYKSKSVNTIETTIEPAMPNPFEKKRNISANADATGDVPVLLVRRAIHSNADATAKRPAYGCRSYPAVSAGAPVVDLTFPTRHSGARCARISRPLWAETSLW
jgi:hypothetical protein